MLGSTLVELRSFESVAVFMSATSKLKQSHLKIELKLKDCVSNEGGSTELAFTSYFAVYEVYWHVKKILF